MKKKFESEGDNYFVMFKQKKVKKWDLCYRDQVTWGNDFDYNLVHKKHEEILRAYLNNRDVKVEFRWYDEDWMLLEGDFIGNYDENMQLRLAEKPFQPFTLNIEVNSLNNLKRLWNIFSVNEGYIEEIPIEPYNSQYKKVDYSDDFTYSIFCDIDDKLNEQLGGN